MNSGFIRAVAACLLVITAHTQALPAFDWHRPPSEPVEITRVNQTFHIQRSALKLNRSLRIPIIVRLEDEGNPLTFPCLVTSLLLTDINTAPSKMARPAQQIFSHRAGVGGGNIVNYEYSNFCEWLFGDNSVEALIPLPNKNLARKNKTLVRDIMIYAGFGGPPRERIVDVELTLQVIDLGSSDHPPLTLRPYGRGCESLRRAAGIPELLKLNDSRGLNRDIVVRSDQISGIVSDQPLNRDNFQSILIDMPSYQRYVHTPVITLSFPSSAEANSVKVLASSYFQSTIWEAKILHPLTPAVYRDGRYSVQFDLAALSNKLHSTLSIFSSRTVALALFLLTDRLEYNPNGTVHYKLQMNGAAAGALAAGDHQLTAVREYIRDPVKLSWDGSSIVIGCLAIVCVMLLIQGLAQTMSTLIDNSAGYELLANKDCRNVLQPPAR